MSLDLLTELVHSGAQQNWTERNVNAFGTLFGATRGRYREAAKKDVTLRAPGISTDSSVSFAAYIHPSNPKSGSYSGLSFVVFPIVGEAALVGLVVGTGGLSPDEEILARPGHARKVQAICSWLNREFGCGSRIAWAKHDPTRTDLTIPDDLRRDWGACKAIFDRYGKEIYALYRPTANRKATTMALTAFLDLMFQERGHITMSGASADADAIRAQWFEYLMPGVQQSEVEELLAKRRYVVLQGPPGTGKTRMALELLQREYGGCGESIQFHPNITYENFIGGLAPTTSGGELGLRFTPTPGFLMKAAAAALGQERPYLLHIDEINRADLGKIPGEAIFLLEPNSSLDRKIELPYDFGPPFDRTFYLPKNLHILGTMNTADRSIAILDVACTAAIRVCFSLAQDEGGSGTWLRADAKCVSTVGNTFCGTFDR